MANFCQLIYNNLLARRVRERERWAREANRRAGGAQSGEVQKCAASFDRAPIRGGSHAHTAHRGYRTRHWSASHQALHILQGHVRLTTTTKTISSCFGICFLITRMCRTKESERSAHAPQQVQSGAEGGEAEHARILRHTRASKEPTRAEVQGFSQHEHKRQHEKLECK